MTLKNARNPWLLCTAALALLMACGGDGGDGLRRVQGGKRYGGVFNMNEAGGVRNIFPLRISQTAEHRIAAQIYQGLVRFDPVDLKVLPCLAERWEVDADATTFTLYLRKDVRFHPDAALTSEDDRLVDAEDVLYCFRALCTADPENRMFWLFQDKVLGANTHYANTAAGGDREAPIAGLEVVDPHTFRIKLAHPNAGFLQVLAHQGCWIYPRQLVEAYGDDLMAHAIGTGPFKLRTYSPAEAFVLERDPDHWDRDEHGNPLPFLDAVRITLDPDKNKELEAFLAGRLSCLTELPVERLGIITDSVEASGRKRFVLQSVPGSAVQFYGFNLNADPFSDLRVRRAFSLAIDRHFLVDSVLGGLAVPAEHGLVAPGLSGYPYSAVDGHRFDPDAARALLAEAGFPGGKGFPQVVLNASPGFGYIQVAEAVQDMLQRHLGVPLILSVLPMDQHYTSIERGRARFWREGWVADLPDAENFLSLLYGKNAQADTALPTYLNTTRYADPRFDSLFAEAQRTVDDARRMQLFAEAENQAMADAPVTPLYHERTIRLLRPDVRDMPLNAMDLRDLARVWSDPGVTR